MSCAFADLVAQISVRSEEFATYRSLRLISAAHGPLRSTPLYYQKVFSIPERLGLNPNRPRSLSNCITSFMRASVRRFSDLALFLSRTLTCFTNLDSRTPQSDKGAVLCAGRLVASF
jgi:hypothetical protein